MLSFDRAYMLDIVELNCSYQRNIPFVKIKLN